jgi:hypothetical protein
MATPVEIRKTMQFGGQELTAIKFDDGRIIADGLPVEINERAQTFKEEATKNYLTFLTLIRTANNGDIGATDNSNIEIDITIKTNNQTIEMEAKVGDLESIHIYNKADDTITVKRPQGFNIPICCWMLWMHMVIEFIPLVKAHGGTEIN